LLGAALAMGRTYPFSSRPGKVSLDESSDYSIPSRDAKRHRWGLSPDQAGFIIISQCNIK
jgi:hypothetical protein